MGPLKLPVELKFKYYSLGVAQEMNSRAQGKGKGKLKSFRKQISKPHQIAYGELLPNSTANAG